jgi:hypothetical protein
LKAPLFLFNSQLRYSSISIKVEYSYLRPQKMRWIKWAGVIASLVMVISCFMTWVVVPGRNIVISGVDTTGTHFGKPAYIHFILVALFLAFTFIRTTVAKRLNLAIGAFSLAWAVRNYFIISLCRAGECPEKKIAIYLIVICAVIMLVSTMFPDMKEEQMNNGKSLKAG